MQRSRRQLLRGLHSGLAQMDRSLRLSGQDFSTGPKHQQADAVAKAPAGEGDFYDFDPRPTLSRHVRGYREPPPVPACPDIGIAAIPLLPICRRVAGARVDDRDISEKPHLNLLRRESADLTGRAVCTRNCFLSTSDPSGFEHKKSSARISSNRCTSPCCTDWM